LAEVNKWVRDEAGGDLLGYTEEGQDADEALSK